MSMYDAKKKSLLELKKAMMGDDTMGGLGDALKAKKMQKVTIASDSPEGLHKGLSKAQEIMAAKGLDEDSEEGSPGEEALESPAEESSEIDSGDETDVDSLKAEIAKLKAELAKRA
jgi:hypothetical protein